MQRSFVQTAESTIQRRRLVVQGIVQGVGFRPFIYGQALRCDLGGFVLNDSADYFTAGYELAHSGDFPLPLKRAPLYPVFLAGVIATAGRRPQTTVSTPIRRAMTARSRMLRVM